MISPAQLKEIFQSFPDNCVLLKPDLPRFNIIEVNRSFEKITGINKEKVLGSDLIEFFSNENLDKEFEDILLSSLQNALKSGKTDFGITLQPFIAQPSGKLTFLLLCILFLILVLS